MKTVNFIEHSLCDKHSCKHLTCMESFHSIRLVIMNVPVRHTEKYMFHCQTTEMEKPGT